jgi:hypothetical protein
MTKSSTVNSQKIPSKEWKQKETYFQMLETFSNREDKKIW